MYHKGGLIVKQRAIAQSSTIVSDWRHWSSAPCFNVSRVDRFGLSQVQWCEVLYDGLGRRSKAAMTLCSSHPTSCHRAEVAQPMAHPTVRLLPFNQGGLRLTLTHPPHGAPQRKGQHTSVCFLWQLAIGPGDSCTKRVRRRRSTPSLSKPFSESTESSLSVSWLDIFSNCAPSTCTDISAAGLVHGMTQPPLPPLNSGWPRLRSSSVCPDHMCDSAPKNVALSQRLPS